MSFLLASGLAINTRRTYSTGEKHFLLFLFLFQSVLPHPLLPANQHTIFLFAVYLSTTYPYSTIKNYLYGVRALHIVNSWPNPVEMTPKLQLLLRGIKRNSSKSSRPKLPITLLILHVFYRF
eukprot:Lithocolla_globosa_v1_NODE_1926_length_2257_cov_11.401453.p2 type:complete len:122 gc:universal NODE_1926_length_2257_cov_11.401453:422-787(+)